MFKQKGFTLVELLVVIAIIALLMARSVPALTRVRDLARAAVCRGNLKTYGLAGQIYLDDNNRRFPCSNTWMYSVEVTQYTNWGCAWHTAGLVPDGPFWPYLGKNPKICLCPTFVSLTKTFTCPRCQGAIPMNPQYSYSMNSWLGPGTDNLPRPSSGGSSGSVLMDSQVKHPANVLWFTEVNVNNIDNDDFWVVPSNGINVMATYHSAPAGDLTKGSGVAAFVDGHVEMIRMKYNYKTDPADYWPDAYKLVNPMGN